MADFISKYPTGQAVDAQLDKANHDNREVLNQFSETSEQVPLYRGKPIGNSGGDCRKA